MCQMRFLTAGSAAADILSHQERTRRSPSCSVVLALAF